MKKIVLTFVSVMLAAGTFAQTIFTYGKIAVSKDEFVRAYNKNPTLNADRKKALKEYLDLYINFKLKVQAAYDARLDKDATQEYELQNFRKQIADNIINDEANVKGLVRQAFERSQKEIRLQQVFIEVPPGADTTEAFRRIQLAYKQLSEGKEFAAVAQEFSSDEATRQSKGELGFITVFTLPFEIENHVYSLSPNSISAPVKTKAGYHIFRNAGEREAHGSRRVAQILISVPPNATAEDKTIAAQKADSVYNLINIGADFGGLAASISNDLSSNTNRGELPDFTVGTYDAAFENVAFSLKNKGDFSKPFQSAYGYHILKLLDATPSPIDISDPVTFATLQEKVEKDSRLDISKKELIQKKLGILKFKPFLFKADDLFVFTDSALRKNNVAPLRGITENTPLFSFGRQVIKAGDWIRFAKNSTQSTFPSGNGRYRELYKEYLTSAADEYYRNNLEVYNPEYLKQLKEFREANLLFGIMEKNVWGKANTDTLGLLEYYNQNKSKYLWPPSADAVIVTCNNQSLAEEVQRQLKENVAGWKQLAGNIGTDVAADSGRFELGQLSVVDKINFTTGLVTTPVKNQNDGTYTFNYIVNIYDQPAQRSFDDARGMVISDYQQVLEDKWIVELKKRYPVKVNQAVFKTIK